MCVSLPQERVPALRSVSVSFKPSLQPGHWALVAELTSPLGGTASNGVYAPFTKSSSFMNDCGNQNWAEGSQLELIMTPAAHRAVFHLLAYCDFNNSTLQ